MIKDIIIISALSVIMISAVIFGISESGSPFETRARNFDTERVTRMQSLTYNIEDYYRKEQKLPNNISDLGNFSGKNSNDPESNAPFEYQSTGDTTYKLCATFKTDHKESSEQSPYYQAINKNFEYKKGHQCFDLEIANPLLTNSSYANPSPITVNVITGNKEPKVQSTNKTSTILDPKIDSVETTVQNIKYSNFPFGFFSDDINEWGLITSSNSATIKVKFKEPVKIHTISVLFSECPATSCFTWDLDGITTENVQKKMTNFSFTVGSDSESKQQILLEDSFKQVNIRVFTKGDYNDYIYFKKMRFEYK